MNYENIQKAIFSYLDGVAGLPNIYWPNVSASTPTGNHLVVWLLPNDTDTIGLNSTSKAGGILQIDVTVKESVGSVKAAAIVDDVIAAFPRGTALTEGVTTVRVDQSASVSQAIHGNGWYKIPVRIPYYSFY